jgi:predicted RNA methylase
MTKTTEPSTTTQTKGLKRNTIDKYYTKPNVVNNCINLIKTHITITKDDLIIEPSAGNGAFIPYIKQLTNHFKFYDLEPEHNDIIQQNFLDFDYTQLKKNYKKIHIIGNPPFGRQSSSAIKFIKKCCEFASSISFILPKSFKKESMKKRFTNNFHLIHEIDLTDNSFLVNGNESDVPCVFQIWEYNQTTPRAIITKQKPIDFEFVKKTDTPDISFRRVGVNAGTIMTDIEDKSEQSHYFIKFTNKNNNEDNKLDETIKKLKNIKFDFNNTVGPKSISKQELILEFNKLLITN